MIHRYRYKDLNIVLDVESGAVHLLDELAYAMLGQLAPPLAPQPVPGPPLDTLRAFGNSAAARDAYGELYALYEAGQLFAEPAHDSFKDKLGLSPLKALCLNVCHDCNLRCDYCFAGQGDYSDGRAMMSAEVGRRAIDYLVANCGEREGLEADFFGGEPLMNFGVVKDVVAYAREKEREWGKRFRFTITTNGLLLDSEKIDFINREMSNVVLSLDGRRDVNDRVRRRIDGTGCYDSIVPGFQELVRKRGDGEYYVRGTYTRHNCDFAEDVLALYRLGFDQISVEPVVAPPERPYALTEADLPALFAEYDRLTDILLDERRRGGGLNFFHFMLDLSQGPCAVKRLRGCGSGNEYLAVTPDGGVYPCHQFAGLPEWRMGSVLDGSLDMQKKTYFADCTILNKEDCRACWARFYCCGGCNANSYLYRGDVRKAHTLSCELEKKRLECAIALKAMELMATAADDG